MKLSRNTNTNTNIKTKKGLSHHGTPTVPITTTAAGDADIVSATCAATPSASNRDPSATPNTMAAGRWARLGVVRSSDIKMLSDEYFMKWSFTTGLNGLYFFRKENGFMEKYTPQQLISKFRDKMGVDVMKVQFTQKGHEKVKMFGNNTRNMMMYMARILYMNERDGCRFNVILDFQDFQDRLNEEMDADPKRSDWMRGRREILKAAKMVMKGLEHIDYDERVLYYFSLLTTYGDLPDTYRHIDHNYVLSMEYDGKYLIIRNADCGFDELIEDAFNSLMGSFYARAFDLRLKHENWPPHMCWDAAADALQDRLFGLVYSAAGKRGHWIEMTSEGRGIAVRLLKDKLEELKRMNIGVLPEEAIYEFKSGGIGEPEFGWANSGIVNEDVGVVKVDLMEDIVPGTKIGRYVKSYEEVAEKMKRKWKNLEIGCSKEEVLYMLGTNNKSVFRKYVEMGYFVEVSKGPGYKGGAWKLREAVDGTMVKEVKDPTIGGSNRLGIKKKRGIKIKQAE